ncbi:RNA polymerase recycling motor HelD [Carnobacterium gallinarum]|uniref:RNA polymerase recycling motor HelD n=1 Tax=Carnobacterium gallinarum TaxID=2749 RepID=UPI000557BD9A|nr:RNA polymerase recycling motor HelD [Carnobacterium gallinarum]
MEVNEHDFNYEQRRVDWTISEILRREIILTDSVESVRGEAQDIRSNFWKDVTVNVSESDDVIETEVSIRQQELLLQERELNYKHAEKQLKAMKKLKSSPYFARIDIQEGQNESETIYIGTASFMDQNDEFLIYDWRAPISSVYYDGALGEVEYLTPDGTQIVEVSLKRQFIIKDAQIEAMFDTTETIGDEMLQDILGNQSNSQMKTIVSTIQQEQNKIIRDTTSQLLFVQGAAGSGKTSAILQRIAYLLYHFRNGLDSNQVVIFSPNKLFNHYISNVLPELGEKNMIQTTFLDFAQARIHGLRVESLFEQFENKENKQRQELLNLKENAIFYRSLDRYAGYLEKGGMIFKDIKFKQEILFTKKKVAEIFYSFPSHYTMPQRFTYTTEKLLDELNRLVRKESKKEWVEELLESLSEEEYKGMSGNQKFESFKEEQTFLAMKVVRKQFKHVRKSINQRRYYHLKAQYADFLKVVPKLIKLDSYGISLTEWQSEQSSVISKLNKKQIMMEDSVPYLYLKDITLGKEMMRTIKFVFIDEIQDYSALQITYLKSLFPNARFTMLGDLNQLIFKNKKQEDSLFDSIAPLFDPERIQKIELTKTYRSTADITNFTKGILVDSDTIEAFERKGDLPKVVIDSSYPAMIDSVVEAVAGKQRESNLTAIIGKTIEDCEKAYELLKTRIDSTLISKENQKLTEGIIVLPSYLAKGLEFDTVVVLDASNHNYHLESERTLLYTICSRAMHHLVITSNGPKSTLFDHVPSELYQIK